MKGKIFLLSNSKRGRNSVSICHFVALKMRMRRTIAITSPTLAPLVVATELLEAHKICVSLHNFQKPISILTFATK
jgi:hypothetical protein